MAALLISPSLASASTSPSASSAILLPRSSRDRPPTTPSPSLQPEAAPAPSPSPAVSSPPMLCASSIPLSSPACAPLEMSSSASAPVLPPPLRSGLPTLYRQIHPLPHSCSAALPSFPHSSRSSVVPAAVAGTSPSTILCVVSSSAFVPPLWSQALPVAQVPVAAAAVAQPVRHTPVVEPRSAPIQSQSPQPPAAFHIPRNLL